VVAKIMKKEIAAAAEVTILITRQHEVYLHGMRAAAELTAETANNNPGWSLKLYVFSPARVSARPANVAMLST